MRSSTCNLQAGEYAGEVGAKGTISTDVDRRNVSHLQCLGDVGEVGDVGEYFGDDGDICAVISVS